MFGFMRKRQTWKEQERLTRGEEELIRTTGHCPDCGGDLRRGPQGGMSVNVCCLRCHSEFNLTFWRGQVVGGQRISDRVPRDLGDRKECYGL